MKPLYLLDTNIISELSKIKPNENVENRIAGLRLVCAIPSIAWHEMTRGYYKLVPSRKRLDLENFLFKYVQPTFPVIPYNEHAALIHADFRAKLEEQGINKPYADSQIAAIAIANNMILVTRNTKDFEDIPLLMMENWFEGEKE